MEFSCIHGTVHPRQEGLILRSGILVGVHAMACWVGYRESDLYHFHCVLALTDDEHLLVLLDQEEGPDIHALIGRLHTSDELMCGVCFEDPKELILQAVIHNVSVNILLVVDNKPLLQFEGFFFNCVSVEVEGWRLDMHLCMYIRMLFTV